MYKTLELTLDTERTNNSKTNAQNFLVNTNDYESVKIIADIVQDKERVDLSDATVKLAIRKPDQTIVFQDGTVTAAIEGECEFVLETQSYVLKGTHVAEVMIYFADGKIVVTRAFAYHVAEGILSDAAIESTSWYQDVNELQLAVQELQVEVDAFIATAVAETRAEITEVDTRLTSQLADIVINVKRFGAVGDGVADDTTAILNAIAACPEGATLYIPTGNWKITNTIYINKQIDVVIKGELIYAGTRDKPAIHFKSLDSRKIRIETVTDVNSAGANWFTGYHGWDSLNYVGVKLESTKFCDVSIEKIRNFTVGLLCQASGGSGFWFNSITFRESRNNMRHLELNTDGINSFMNGNYFYETSPGYNSGSFVSSAKDRYSVIQTMTNGNEYQANSNFFYKFKFEAAPPTGGTWNQIYLINAAGFKFLQTRVEINGMNLITMDLTKTNTSIATLGAHSSRTLVEVLTSVGNYTHEITNSQNINGTYEDVLKIVDPARQQSEKPRLLYSVDDLQNRYRRVSDNLHIIRGLYHMDVASTAKTPRLDQFTNSERLVDNGVNISGSYPVVVFLENVKKGETYRVEVTSADGSKTLRPIYKCFDATPAILPEKTDGYKTIGGNIFFNSGQNAWYPNANNNQFEFTINHANVKSVAILISGALQSFRVTTVSDSTSVVKKSTDAVQNRLSDKLLYTTKPVRKIDGYFVPGDRVYNPNNATGQTIGWELKDIGSNVLDWVSIGVY